MNRLEPPGIEAMRRAGDEDVRRTASGRVPAASVVDVTVRIHDPSDRVPTKEPTPASRRYGRRVGP